MSEESQTGADETGDEVSLTSEQRDALALGHNIAVTAGAGTGKTTTLKERYRKILTTEPETGPDGILTLTFTKDATNEMHDQIREVIDEQLAAASDETYDRWRRAKDELTDAYIHTIHGFCSRVLREFAVEANVHPEFETLDEGDAGTLIQEAITAVLDRYGLDERAASDTGRLTQAADEHAMGEWDWDVREELATLTQLYSRSNLESTLESLFSERPDSTEWADRWADQSPSEYLAHCSEFVDVSIPATEAERLMEADATQEAIAELLRLGDLALEIPEDDNGVEILDELTAFLRDTGAHTPTGSTIDRQLFLLNAADAVTTGSGTLQSQTWRYAGSKGTWSDYGREDERAALKEALDTLADVIEPEARNLDHNPVVARNGAEQAIALARVFEAVRVEYDRLKDRRNALDYSDLITETIDFLAEHDTARRTLRDQFEYIMIDEVQDTDPRQWNLIQLLSGDDPDRFDGGNVFLVGDEKQSIYRFRDADVTQFRAARSRLLDDNPSAVDGNLELTGNFRTIDPTLTVINELFEEVLQPAAHDEGSEADTDGSSDGEEVDHEPYEAEPQWLDTRRQNGTSIDGSVEYMVVPKDEDADAALGLADSWFTQETFVSEAEREAKAVAARLTQLFDGDGKVYDRDAEARVAAQPRHVALLFRSSNRLAAFERELDAEGIPYTNLAGSGFYDTPEVVPLLNLLKVFEDPTADIPLYGVLRSPLFGFTDSEIARARAPDMSLWDGLASTTSELRAAREQISDWRQSAGLEDTDTICQWSTLLSRIIDDTGYLISIGADDRPQQAIANVEKFREQLRNWEESSARSVTDLIDRIERARDGDADPSEATVPGDVEGVQLRTIHSAKGLEFPIVLIPEITRQFNMRSSLSKAHIERIDDDPVIGMKAPSAGNAYRSTNTATYLHVRTHHRRRERAEQRRLLYVAATRARDHLLLSGTHGVDTETASGLSKVGDWDEAWHWSDWVQPTMLDVPDLVTHLGRDGTLETTLGEGPYSIRRPTPPADWSPVDEAESLPTDLEIPAPTQEPSRTRFSATGFRDHLAEMATHWPAVLREADTTEEDGTSMVDDEAAIDALDAATVGTAVHKLCELDPPRSDWPDIVCRCVDDPDAVSSSAIDAIVEHTEAGLQGLQRLEADHAISSRHSELSVTLDLPDARVVGDIDHLSVTADDYLVVDYKTSDLERQSLATLTEHYLPQLVAYAGALIQNDGDAESVEVALVFTDTGAVKRRVLSRQEIGDLMEWANDTLGGDCSGT
ncbi:UvrD-helicase domain-containing protein [Natronomonas amylolytica]|uniref:UvrD-helicase domain-containing protein n=1 Tax=Natronomonas amylolytica TaxID=3108498 RepID=UPI00300A16EA